MLSAASLLVALWSLTPVNAVTVSVARKSVKGTANRSLREPVQTDGSVFKAMHFDQRLLICNAYPSSASAMVSKNDQVLTDSKHGVAYRECRYIDSQVRPQDKLELALPDLEIRGTFDVGDLPATDAVLLLVLEKRPGSAFVSFKSFAFPSGGHTGSEAQLAVIDAFSGEKTASPRLKMMDHLAEGQQTNAAAVSRRIEELAFNRVYAVEEGTYDTAVQQPPSPSSRSLLQKGQPPKDKAKHMKEPANMQRTLKISRGQNYVLLLTGDDMLGEPSSLVIFPDSDFRSRASLPRMSLIAWCSMAAAIAIRFL